jgi:hypothetical protein
VQCTAPPFKTLSPVKTLDLANFKAWAGSLVQMMILEINPVKFHMTSSPLPTSFQRIILLNSDKKHLSPSFKPINKPNLTDFLLST